MTVSQPVKTSRTSAPVRTHRPIATGSFACFAFASLLTLSACSSLKVGLGMRVDLTKVPVASMEASLPKGPAIAPGQTSPLVVEVTPADAKSWSPRARATEKSSGKT